MRDDDDLFLFPEEESKSFLSEQIISYIGNKRKLIGFIDDSLENIKKDLGKNKINILDGFAGSGIVSRSFKRHAAIFFTGQRHKFKICYYFIQHRGNFIPRRTYFNIQQLWNH